MVMSCSNILTYNVQIVELLETGTTYIVHRPGPHSPFGRGTEAMFVSAGVEENREDFRYFGVCLHVYARRGCQYVSPHPACDV